MPDIPDRQPVSSDDLRALAVQLTDESHQLQAALTVEIRELARSIAADARADVDHMAELALGELRVARQELIRRARAEPDEPRSASKRLERRITALIVAGNIAVTIANAVVVTLAG